MRLFWHGEEISVENPATSDGFRILNIEELFQWLKTQKREISRAACAVRYADDIYKTVCDQWDVEQVGHPYKTLPEQFELKWKDVDSDLGIVFEGPAFLRVYIDGVFLSPGYSMTLEVEL